MKVTHVLIGAGIAVAVIIVAKKYFAPGTSSSASDPAKPSVGNSIDNLVKGVDGVLDGVKGIFGKKSTAPAAPSREAPVPGVNFDADEDQNGQYAINVIPFRAEA